MTINMPNITIKAIRNFAGEPIKQEFWGVTYPLEHFTEKKEYEGYTPSLDNSDIIIYNQRDIVFGTVVD